MDTNSNWTFFSIPEKEKSSYVVQDIEDYRQIQYVGNWTHMTIEKNGKTGSYANTNQDTARFKFWGYGVQIRTELMMHHKAYKVFLDDVFMETINVQNPINTTNNLTYSYMDLKPLKRLTKRFANAMKGSIVIALVALVAV